MCCDLVVAGGARAPTPVGDLGFVEMTQAVEVAEAEWQQVRVCMYMYVCVFFHVRVHIYMRLHVFTCACG